MSCHPKPKWRPCPFIRASIALHGLALIWIIVWPEFWITALAAIAVNHMVMGIFVFWPTNSYLGYNRTRLPQSARQRGEIALSFDDGPDPDITPRVLEILDQYQAKATFFVIGEHALHYPELCREIIRRGHTVENHSQHHKYTFSLLGWQGIMQEITQAQRSIKNITGQEPRFFRAPMGMRNPILDPVLSRLGLQLVTWNRRGYDTRSKNSAIVLTRLTRKLQAGDIVLLHDGNSAIGLSGQPVVLEVLPKLLDIIAAKGLRTVVL